MSDPRPVEVLLVEDDAAHAEIVRRCLAGFAVPCRLSHVSDGQAALDRLQAPASAEQAPGALTPDLILLDLRLPKIDGLEVLRRLKQHPATRSIPTVVLTTSAHEDDIDGAYRAGAGSYLVKPVDFERLRKLLADFGSYWLKWNQFPP